MNYHCDLHRQKTLGIVCTYASCPKKGIICVLCQHEDHLDHSHYCLPLEILIEKCEKLKTNNKDLIKEIKKKLKLINDGSKLLLKEFVKKVTDVCASISKEIDANAEREIELLEDIIRRDERMVQDFKKFDECLDNYKMNIRPHMQNIIVDINVEKVEKIRFTCHSSDSCFRELHDLERKTKEFEEYLRDSFKEAENCLNDLFIVKNGKESGRSSPSLSKSTQEFLPIRCDTMNQSDVFSKNGQMKEEETKSSKEERNGKEVISEIKEKMMANGQDNKECSKITQPLLPLKQSIHQEFIGKSNEQNENGNKKLVLPQKDSNEQNENGNQKLCFLQNGQGLFSKKGNEQSHFPNQELNEKLLFIIVWSLKISKLGVRHKTQIRTSFSTMVHLKVCLKIIIYSQTRTIIKTLSELRSNSYLEF